MSLLYGKWNLLITSHGKIIIIIRRLAEKLANPPPPPVNSRPVIHSVQLVSTPESKWIFPISVFSSQQLAVAYAITGTASPLQDNEYLHCRTFVLFSLIYVSSNGSFDSTLAINLCNAYIYIYRKRERGHRLQKASYLDDHSFEDVLRKQGQLLLTISCVTAIWGGLLFRERSLFDEI